MRAVRKLAPGPGHVELVEVPEPRPPAGHAVVAVRAAGICGTDLHILHDEFPTVPPVTLGHEVTGEVVELGAGVDGWAVGDRVVTETYYAVCGVCEGCRGGRPNLCPSRRSIGSKVDGGFAELLEVPAANLHRLPEGLSFRAAALTEPLACTVYALDRVAIRPGEWVVVSGPGPMGLLAAQVAAASGGRVIVLGLSADRHRLKIAATLGAELTLDVQALGQAAAVEQLLEVTGGGAQVVAECAGAAGSAGLLLDLVRRGGRYAQIGLYGRTATVDLDTVCYKDLTVTGTNASIPATWPRALELLGRGVVDGAAVVSQVFGLERWQEAFATLQAGAGMKLLLSPTPTFSTRMRPVDAP